MYLKSEFLDYVKEIKDEAFENAVVFDSRGNFMFRLKGKRNSIEFGYHDRYKLRGTIFMHNHPCGGGFSLPDIWTACALNMSGMIVATSDYVYMFFPPLKRPDFEISELGDIREVYERQKSMLPLSRRFTVQDELWKVVAETLNYQYLKLRLNKS